jgi:mono/diheme cytochrome c family protein
MKDARRVPAVLLVLALGALAACGGGKRGAAGGEQASAETAQSGTEAVQITPEARTEAQQVFASRCAVCHGAEGRGDGPGGAALTPKPRNYHDAAWQDSVTDQEIEQAIVYGGAAVGRSPAMVANPDLGNKPAVVAALREMIRNFGTQQ